MAKEFFQIRLDPELKQKLAETAQERGLTTSEGARQAFELWSGFDSKFFLNLQKLASIYSTSPYRIFRTVAPPRSLEYGEMWRRKRLLEK